MFWFSMYSSICPSIRPCIHPSAHYVWLCLVGERERERLARTVELLPDRFNGSFICLLFVPGYTTTVTLQSTHTHTPLPFFFVRFFFVGVRGGCCLLPAILLPSHLSSPPLPFSFFFFFLFISFYLFICLFIFFIRGASFHFVVRRDLALARTQTSQSTNKSNSTSECNVITCVFYSTEEGEKEEDERHNNNEKMGNCRCRCCWGGK